MAYRCPGLNGWEAEPCVVEDYKEPAGELDKDVRAKLVEWIGSGPKTFKLLFSITRDGCNAARFHQLCDNKGPTVTVLYNTNGFVFGGYTSVSWQPNSWQSNSWQSNSWQPNSWQPNSWQSNSWQPNSWQPNSWQSNSWQPNNYWLQDQHAFLFLKGLQSNAMYDKFSQYTKFPLVQNGYTKAVYSHRNYGPTFGSQPDLLTFQGDLDQNQFGYFQLNGHFNPCKTYSVLSGGLPNFDGNMMVTELEVYQVQDGKADCTTPRGKPWRKTKEWNDKFLAELIEDIVAFKPLGDLKIRDARILMVGPVGAGKSSFFNTVNSIFRGRVTQRVSSGNAEQSLTTSYTPYKVTALNFRLCDTRGLEENRGLDVIECNFLLDGHIPNHYEFNPAKPITPKTPGFKESPTADDKIQCGVFVLDCTTLDVLSPKIVEKIKGIKSLMNEKGVPQVILLTKIDRLSKAVAADTSNAYKCREVEQAVDKAAQLLGLPRANVLPVKNYENELELDDNISILALLCLRQILRHAEDCMENALDRQVDEEDIENCKKK